MPHALALSRAARTLIARQLSGERAGVTPENLRAYRELVAAELMTASNEELSFGLTEAGPARRREFVLEADGPSGSALSLLRCLVSGESVEVSDETRPADRELAAAGIMVALHTFARGGESAYRFTEEGWNRRREWLNPSSNPARSLEASPSLGR